MIGFWVDSRPVKTDRADVLATAYVRDGRTLVALASWAKERVDVQLSIDWTALGLDPATAAITAPAIEKFQDAATFADRPADPSGAGKGMADRDQVVGHAPSARPYFPAASTSFFTCGATIRSTSATGAAALVRASDSSAVSASLHFFSSDSTARSPNPESAATFCTSGTASCSSGAAITGCASLASSCHRVSAATMASRASLSARLARKRSTSLTERPRLVALGRARRRRSG